MKLYKNNNYIIQAKVFLASRTLWVELRIVCFLSASTVDTGTWLCNTSVL